MTMMLIAILITGEVEMIRVPHDLCRSAYEAVEAGEVVSLDMPDGRRRVPIHALSCVPAELFVEPTDEAPVVAESPR